VSFVKLKFICLYSCNSPCVTSVFSPLVVKMFASAGGKKEQLGEKIQRVKGVLEHVGLYVGLACYTAIGAKVFQELENPHEVDTLETYQALLISKREVFLRSVWNESSNSANYREVRKISGLKVNDFFLSFSEN
jgi:hypothetical protein